ncbi:nucleotidyltransferase family protein [Streptomyces zingiberis]|uniref:NTP transferase domain-containing protein n=1 Tax=Streptomyces zingiberis TaxID=2053010 RepID=A0ABX1C349_9ACTN|nr:NTP transferase domain-containing protein [Streptomyces zingiberis]NJQ03863.1 NTP transferase domain-containing protein [Streptomyces zingiberis]
MTEHQTSRRTPGTAGRSDDPRGGDRPRDGEPDAASPRGDGRRADGPRVAGLLLAAGGGRRLGGRPKALLPHDGGLLVERAAAALRAGGCDPVHVVLGAGADRVRARAALPGCVLVEHPGWAEGMGTSLRAGLASLATPAAVPGGPVAVLVMLVDQPGVGAAAVARVRGAYRSPASLAAASYDGRRGHPVLLGTGHWTAVAEQATGDRGARAYLAEHRAEITLVDCSGLADPGDVDTPGDLWRLTRSGEELPAERGREPGEGPGRGPGGEPAR